MKHLKHAMGLALGAIGLGNVDCNINIYRRPRRTSLKGHRHLDLIKELNLFVRSDNGTIASENIYTASSSGSNHEFSTRGQSKDSLAPRMGKGKGMESNKGKGNEMEEKREKRMNSKNGKGSEIEEKSHEGMNLKSGKGKGMDAKSEPGKGMDRKSGKGKATSKSMKKSDDDDDVDDDDDEHLVEKHIPKKKKRPNDDKSKTKSGKSGKGDREKLTKEPAPVHPKQPTQSPNRPPAVTPPSPTPRPPNVTPTSPTHPPSVVPPSPPSLPPQPAPTSIPDEPAGPTPTALPTTTPARPTITPTSSPTPTGIAISLTPFGLFYFFELSRQPTVLEIATAAALTQAYVENFFLQRIPDIVEVNTFLQDSQHSWPSPFRMEYSTRVFFDPASSNIPSIGELDLLRTLAFSGNNRNTYVALLRELPGENIFSTTTDVSDTPTRSGRGRKDNGDPVEKRDGSAKVSLLASIGAGAFVALLFGISFLRGRINQYEEVKKATDGRITVDGETYLASTMYSRGSETESTFGRTTARATDAHSEWGLSTKCGVEEDGLSVDRTLDFAVAADRAPGEELSPMFDASQIDPLSQEALTLDYYESEDESENEYSDLSGHSLQRRESDAPLSVVDLIRKFSTRSP